MAKADTFNFSTASSVYTGSGVLTGYANGDGSFTVTGITGSGITGLIAANDPDLGNDNLLFPANSRKFDVLGIAFSGNFGRLDLFSTVSGYEVQGFDLSGTYFDVPATASITSAAAVTPEPSSLLLSLTGTLILAAACFSKRLPLGVTR